MSSTTRRSFSSLGALKERLSERLGDFLYRLFIEAYNPFGTAEVVDAVETQRGNSGAECAR